MEAQLKPKIDLPKLTHMNNLMWLRLETGICSIVDFMIWLQKEFTQHAAALSNGFV